MHDVHYVYDILQKHVWAISFKFASCGVFWYRTLMVRLHPQSVRIRIFVNAIIESRTLSVHSNIDPNSAARLIPTLLKSRIIYIVSSWTIFVFFKTVVSVFSEPVHWVQAFTCTIIRWNRLFIAYTLPGRYVSDLLRIKQIT